MLSPSLTDSLSSFFLLSFLFSLAILPLSSSLYFLKKLFAQEISIGSWLEIGPPQLERKWEAKSHRFCFVGRERGPLS